MDTESQGQRHRPGDLPRLRVAPIEREELERLRRENRELKQANELLKLASALSRGNSTRDTTDRRLHRSLPPDVWRRVDLQHRAHRARYHDRAPHLPQSSLPASLGPRSGRCLPRTRAARAGRSAGRYLRTPEVTRYLRRQGHRPAFCTVDRIMREMGTQRPGQRPPPPRHEPREGRRPGP